MSLCWNDTDVHNDTPPFNHHNMTVAFEATAAGISLSVCVYFFAVLIALRWSPRLRKTYTWHSKYRAISLASLVLLQSLTFWVSAAYGFKPQDAPLQFCRIQGMIYQFATSGIAMEVFAVSYAAFKTIVRGVGFQEFQKKYLLNVNLAVYVVALLNTAVPLLAEKVIDSPSTIVYGVVDRSSGYCWMNFRRNCLMIFVYFYYLLQFFAHGASIVLVVQICRTLCRLHGHLKRSARTTIKIFIVRRMLVMVVAAFYFLISFTYAVLYWAHMERSNVAWDSFSSFNAFLQGIAGSLYLVAFLLPDCAYRPVTKCGSDQNDDDDETFVSERQLSDRPSSNASSLAVPLNGGARK